VDTLESRVDVGSGNMERIVVNLGHVEIDPDKLKTGRGDQMKVETIRQ